MDWEQRFNLPRKMTRRGTQTRFKKPNVSIENTLLHCNKYEVVGPHQLGRSQGTYMSVLWLDDLDKNVF